MKTDYIRVRLTELEKEVLKKNAKELSMSMSDYVKFCCLINKPKKESKIQRSKIYD